MWVGGQGHDPTALPPGKTRYQLYRRLSGTQGRSGKVRKISPPPGLDPRTVQPVAQSLYRLIYPGYTVLLTFFVISLLKLLNVTRILMIYLYDIRIESM